MTTTNAHELEAHLQRALLYADRLFLALEEIEAPGGLAAALADRRPQSRDEVLRGSGRRGTSSPPRWGRSTRRRPARPARPSSDGGRTGPPPDLLTHDAPGRPRPGPPPLRGPGPAGGSGVERSGAIRGTMNREGSARTNPPRPRRPH